MSQQLGALERLNQLIGENSEWPEEPVNMVLEIEQFEELIGATEPRAHMSVNTADGLIGIPINLLMKFGLVRHLLDCTAGDEECPINLSKIDIRILNIFIAWNAGELEVSAIPWSDFEAVVRSCDYLQFDDFFRAIAENIIIPRIYGPWYQIRRRLLFTYEACELDDEDWDFDPVKNLNDNNFILDLFPQIVIVEIYYLLSKENRTSFVSAFGDSSHRACLNLILKCDF